MTEASIYPFQNIFVLTFVVATVTYILKLMKRRVIKSIIGFYLFSYSNVDEHFKGNRRQKLFPAIINIFDIKCRS